MRKFDIDMEAIRTLLVEDKELQGKLEKMMAEKLGADITGNADLVVEVEVDGSGNELVWTWKEASVKEKEGWDMGKEKEDGSALTEEELESILTEKALPRMVMDALVNKYKGKNITRKEVLAEVCVAQKDIDVLLEVYKWPKLFQK